MPAGIKGTAMGVDSTNQFGGCLAAVSSVGLLPSILALHRAVLGISCGGENLAYLKIDDWHFNEGEFNKVLDGSLKRSK